MTPLVHRHVVASTNTLLACHPFSTHHPRVFANAQPRPPACSSLLKRASTSSAAPLRQRSAVPRHLVTHVLSLSRDSDASPDEFQALFRELAPLSSRQLQVVATYKPEALSSPFLFFLRDLEQQARKAESTGKFRLSVPAASRVEGAARLSSQQQQQQQTGFILQSQSQEEPPGTPEQGASTAPHAEQKRGASDEHVPAATVARVAAELVALRERQELEASSRLLPTLASSLAYDSLLRWRHEQTEDGLPPSDKAGGELQVGGIAVEDLYKAGEKEERLLEEERAKMRKQLEQQRQRQQTPSWASSSGLSQDLSRSGGSSTIDSFASRPGNEAFKEMAAMAMARMRSRLVGYDDEEDAAVAVLDTLLAAGAEYGRVGWADLMHEAFYPPGILRAAGTAHTSEASKKNDNDEVSASQPQASSGHGSEGQEKEQRVCTTPEALQSAITQRMESVGGTDSSQAGQLQELLEDLQDYMTHVWSQRKGALDRYR